eukprot:COSAG06_NODE_59117_length_275_cov_0.590909_1_plen_23_part_01
MWWRAGAGAVEEGDKRLSCPGRL